MSNRTAFTVVANAIAWAVLLQWPWGQTLVPALVALALIHLVYPLIGSSRWLPLLVAAVDAGFLYAAWQRWTWGELTPVVVAVLGGVALAALAYASTVVLLLHRRAVRRELARQQRDGQGTNGDPTR